MRTATRQARTLGTVLVVGIGVLNFHPPHFLMESGNPGKSGSQVLEVALAAVVAAALVAAAGIYRGHRWGWLLGVVVAAVGVALYVAQETVGLPGLPQQWWEPSRIVTLGLETWYVILAYRVLTSPRRPAR